MKFTSHEERLKNSEILEQMTKLYQEYERRGNNVPKEVKHWIDNELESIMTLKSIIERFEDD